MNAVLLVFVVVEFVASEIARTSMDFILLVFFTWHTCSYEYLRYVADQKCSAFPDSSRPAYRGFVCCTMLLFWAVWLVEITGGPSMRGAIRPFMLIIKSRGVRDMFTLLWKCIYSARMLM